MKKRILDLHVYASLFCAGYFVLYGLSAIAYNHGWSPAPTTVTWEEAVSLAEPGSDLALAEQTRDALGLMGWVWEWTLQRDAPDRLRFTVKRPARRYRIELDQAGGTARVEEQRTGLAGLVLALHGFMRMPASAWSLSWALYTELSAAVLGFAALSGLYLWWQRAAARPLLWLLVAGAAGSLGLMAWILA